MNQITSTNALHLKKVNYFCIVKPVITPIISLLLFLNLFVLSAQKQSSWQQQVNYTIDARLDTAGHGVDAHISMEYVNHSPDKLTQIYIHVWPNAYKDNTTPFAQQLAVNSQFDFLYAKNSDRGYIDRLNFQVDGQPVQWKFLEHQIDVVLLQLNSPLEPGRKVIISTPFYVKLPKVFSRSGYENNFYAVTQWYPKPAVYDVNGWNYMSYLNQGEFYSEYGDFKVQIELPQDYVLAATGNQTERIDTLGKSHYTYEEKSIHDFAWFCSDSLKFMSEPYVLPDGDTVVLEAYYRGRISNVTFKAMGATLEQYGKYVGKYPYKTCKLVIGPLEAGAGMEYPTITLCASDETETIVHEVGHNWFYGIIGNNERRYPWMDESINSYFDKVVTNSLNEFESRDVVQDKKFYHPASRMTWMRSHFMMLGVKQMIAMGTSQAINLHSAEYSNGAYGLVIYGRGPLAFAYLREQLGDTLFFKCFSDYFNVWKYRHPLPGDMQESFEKTCGFSLAWFFKDMLSEVNGIDYKSTKGGSDFKIIGSDSLQSFLKSRHIKSRDVNPYGFMVERNMYNNGQRKKFMRISLPLGIPTFDRQVQVNVMPWVGYNLYDGVYPMLLINNLLLNDRAIDYAFLPGYSFKRDAFNGYGHLSYRHLVRGKRSYWEGGVQGQSYGLTTASRQNSYYKLMPFIRWKSTGGKPGVTKVEQCLQLQFIHTGLDRSHYISNTDSNGVEHYRDFIKDYFYNYTRISYVRDLRYLLNRVRLEVNAENGINNKFNPGSSSYVKLWLKAAYFNYFKKGKKFKTELFAGIMPYRKGNFDFQKFYISGNSGRYDYTYSNVLMGRGENFLSDYLIGRQILDNGGLRNIIALQGSDRWMTTLNTEVDFPGKLPLTFYFDMGYYRYMNVVNGANTNLNDAFCFSTGVQINLLKGVIQVFAPIAYSDNFKNYNLLNRSFLNSIGFRINLNRLEPNKLINGVLLDSKVSLSE